MKIAFVLHQFLPGYNSGTEQYVYHLAKRLIKLGESVHVFTFEPKVDGHPPFTGVRKEPFEDIPVTRISGWMGHFPNIVLSHYYNPFFGRLFADFLREEEIDLVHSFQNQRLGVCVLEEAYLAGIPCVVNLMDFWYLCPHIQLLKNNGSLCDGPLDYKACIDCRAPYDATYQSLIPYIRSEEAVDIQPGNLDDARLDFLAGSDPFQKTAAMAMRPHYIRETLQRVDVLVSPSEFLKSVFVRNGYDPDRFKLVRYGIDRDALSGIVKERSEHLRIGYVGTITAHKGLHTLVQAVRQIPGDGWSLAVHGDLTAFPDYAAHVRELAGDDERIRFCGRFEAPDLAGVLEEIDVMVVPSVWFENTPFVILEALASGTPVIASNLGGLSELIDEGKNGLVFEPGDSNDLRAKIEEVIADRSLVEQYDPGAARVRSLDENLDEFLDLYRRLLEKKSRGANPAVADDGEREMESDDTVRKERLEILERQNQHLMSQLFHLIGMNSGTIRRVDELERALDEKAFLAAHGPSEEDVQVPRDLSPSVQRKLVELEQLKEALIRRNNQIAELERQIETYSVNTRFQDARLKERDDAINNLNAALSEKEEVLRQVQTQAHELESQVCRLQARFLNRIGRGVKGLLKGKDSG